MNFELSAEQLAMREMLHRFVAEQCDRDMIRAVVDERCAWSESLWQAMAELGLLGIGISEDQGGVGGGMIELCLVAEAMGRGLAPVPFAQNALATQIIARFGSPAQQSEWLPAIIQGQLKGSVAKLEGTICDGKAVGQAAVMDGDVADFVILVTDEAVALARLDSPHTDRIPRHSITPLHGLARIALADVPIEKMADGACRWWRDAAAAITAFEQLGGADRVIETTRSHVLERRAFGRPIGSYQAVKHRLVDMHVKAINARAHAYHAAWAIDHDPVVRSLAAAGARVSATEAYRFAARESVQLHGAMGTSWEHDAHLHLKQAEMLALLWGGDAIWKERIVRELEVTHG